MMHHHICKSETIIIYLDGERVLAIKTHKMSIISVDIESNQADLNALVSSANDTIAALQTQLAAITVFQLAFTVTEVPTIPTLEV